jgi:hypothetical protein
MGTNETSLVKGSAPQQPLNGVITGFDPRSAALLLGASNFWPDKDLVPVLLVRALCRLSADDPVKAERGYTPVELRESIREERNRWAEGEADAVADVVRRHWKKLLDLWAGKVEGLQQLARDQGLSFYPALDRLEGGGTGRPTRYRIVCLPLPAPSSGDERFSPATVVGDIRYICEDIEDAGGLARIFARGFEIAGWRRVTFLAIGILAIVLTAGFVWLLMMALPNTKTVGALVSTIFSAVVIIWAARATFGPFYRVVTDRIVSAPWWMQSLEDDRLVEWRKPPRYPEKVLKAVRYTAICPLCGGRVHAMDGTGRHERRIVGSCEESPQEHVFSFDHVTRIGMRLSI